MGSGDGQDRWFELSNAPTVPDACRAVVAVLAARWELPSVYLLIHGRLRCMGASGYFHVVDGFTPQTGVIGRSVRTASMVVVRDAHLEPEFVAAIPDLQSEVCAPVLSEGSCVGAVSLESRGDMPDEAIDDARRAAHMLGLAVDRIGGMPPPSLGQRLARLAVRMTAETDIDLLRTLTVEGAVDISGRSSAALSMVDQSGRWETCAVAGPLGSALASWGEEDLALVAGWVEAGTSSHFPGGAPVPPAYDFLLRSGVRSIGVQPLVAWGSVMGILAVADGEPHAHDAQGVAVLELFASLAASCLRTAAVVHDLARRATHDPLTGLPHLSEFREHLTAACVASAKAGHARATCLLVDVDHFKTINDTLGHEAGDEVLRQLATVLQRELGDGDLLYRIGGDEFAVLVDTGRRSHASAIADRLVAAALASGTSISIGSAAVAGTPAQVRDAADLALYRAKGAGRGVHRSAVD